MSNGGAASCIALLLAAVANHFYADKSVKVPEATAKIGVECSAPNITCACHCPEGAFGTQNLFAALCGALLVVLSTLALRCCGPTTSASATADVNQFDNWASSDVSPPSVTGARTDARGRLVRSSSSARQVHAHGSFY